ncbi:gamma-glutamyl-gamma-aminobutyrate hydrolase [Philodulcilactobacillus myokoensis]|uniref:Gamma-glutamyl-gamma-aminobutyrate hydrolase n=1 Tax=Philodulcilactobacillus myokoensis TaxID=2929573 RepID=A0A9W6ETV8_9LACO|nr:gamma-glutamyl-gamma-aminobutyrate hydrolase family protein [Philodulcilactobacillus myokoensis]GLB47632.1 gamma-glutamyl-gamma-aminobutyrate hydrolase [Philodulcilactobacillus myokoensis]
MRIGITADVNFGPQKSARMYKANMVQHVLIDLLSKHNIVPVMLPVVKPQMAKRLLKLVDGIILTGGPDVAPNLYHEEPIETNSISYQPRDDFEISLIKAAVKNHKPILGLCRGIQAINVALGGTLYQDLKREFHPINNQPLINHSQNEEVFQETHHVLIDQNSKLFQSIGEKALVNSRHHQAVKDLGEGLKITATAPDGVIEGIENADASVQGVQWHPEYLWKEDMKEEKLFTDFFNRVGDDYD